MSSEESDVCQAPPSDKKRPHVALTFPRILIQKQRQKDTLSLSRLRHWIQLNLRRQWLITVERLSLSLFLDTPLDSQQEEEKRDTNSCLFSSLSGLILSLFLPLLPLPFLFPSSFPLPFFSPDPSSLDHQERKKIQEEEEVQGRAALMRDMDCVWREKYRWNGLWTEVSVTEINGTDSATDSFNKIQVLATMFAPREELLQVKVPLVWKEDNDVCMTDFFSWREEGVSLTTKKKTNEEKWGAENIEILPGILFSYSYRKEEESWSEGKRNDDEEKREGTREGRTTPSQRDWWGNQDYFEKVKKQPRRRKKTWFQRKWMTRTARETTRREGRRNLFSSLSLKSCVCCSE